MTDFVAGDTGSTITVTCKDKTTGIVINLTGSTVALKWEDSVGTVASAAMTVSAPLTGVATYQFTSTQLYSPSMTFEVVITDVGGKIVSNLDLIPVVVRARLS